MGLGLCKDYNSNKGPRMIPEVRKARPGESEEEETGPPEQR